MEGRRATLWARLAQRINRPAPTEDQLLVTADAASRLGISKDWLCRHADHLPFRVPLPSRNLRARLVFYRVHGGSMTKRTLATGILALALLATPRVASAGVHFSFGIGLPFFGAVVAPGPAVVVPAPAYVLPPAYYSYPYPPVVAYGPPGYYGGSVVVWGRHYRDAGRHGYWRGRH